MKLPLTGIVPPMVTPLRGRDELDCAGLERLLEHLVGGGVSALFILGTTGEGPSLSYRLRREVVERTCRQVRGRVPVLVGITDTAFVESVNLARHALSCGANALVLALPYYLPGGQPELQEYLEHLVPELPLPIVLYNMPTLTKVNYEADLVRRCLDEPQIIGLKDSSGSMIYFHRMLGIVKQRPDWCLLMGPEELLAESVLAGGHGGISGGANLFPGFYVRLYETAASGDLSRTQQLHRQVMQISSSLYHIGRHSSAVLKGIKCGLSCLGICDDFMAEPFHRFRAEERARVQRHIVELSALIEKLVPAFSHHPGPPPATAQLTASEGADPGARLSMPAVRA